MKIKSETAEVNLKFEIPQNWERVNYSDLVTKTPTANKKIKGEDYLEHGKFPIVDQGQALISGYTNREESVIYPKISCVVFGDHTRAVKQISYPFAPGADGTKVLEPTAGVDANFLYFLTMYVAGNITSKGYARHFQYLESAEIGLPSLDVQIAIASLITNLFVQVERGSRELDRARKSLEQYKQSILSAAIRGNLAPQDPSDESASELLKRIRTEKAALIGSGKLKKAKPLPSIDPDEIPFELPQGWEWARLGELGILKGGITKDAGRRTQDAISLPYLRVANVQRGFLDLQEMKTIAIAQDKIESLLLRSGDVLFNEGGDLDKLGRGWVWEGQLPKCTYQNHVFRLRLLSPEFSPYFISHFTNVFGKNYFMQSGSQTTNLASISITKLSLMPVPIPPLQEQTRIMSCLSFKLKEAAQTEGLLNTQIAAAGRLKLSILKAAFEGKLISS